MTYSVSQAAGNITGKTPPSRPQKLALLESLRGIAALLIVAFHANELFTLKFGQPFLGSLFQFGDSGVDFFFVLSGFFLALSSFKYIGQTGKASGFLLKRCVRIYPFYWFVTLGLVPVYFLMPSFGKGHERELGTLFTSLLLIPQGHAPIVSVAWFLSHLVFFYLIFTAVILAPKIFSKVVFVGLVLSALFMVADIGSGYQLREGAHFLTNFVFSYYNLEFAAGCWLGGLLSGSFKRTPLKTSVSLAMLLIGCLAFILSGLVEVYALRTGSENPGFVHYYEFVTYGLSSVLIVGGAAFLEKRHQIQINRALVILGAASFSIYLTHYSILSVLTKAIQAVGISNFGFQTVSMVLACAVAVFIGCIAHFYIEKRLVAILRNRLITKRL